MPESLTAAPDFHLETGVLPVMEFEKDIELGRYARHSTVQRIYLCANWFEICFIFTLTSFMSCRWGITCTAWVHIFAVTAHKCKLS